MQWSAPAYLWLLLLPLALAALGPAAARRRREELAKVAGTEGAAAVEVASAGMKAGLRRLIPWAAWLLLVISLAGPKWGVVAEERRSQGAEILVALDTSRSMLTDDLAPSRLAAAKEAIAALGSELRGDRIGLIAFAGSAFLVCPLTSDYGAFATALAETGVASIPLGGSSLAAALTEASRAFGAKGEGRALILVSDGEDHAAGYSAAARALKERGVALYTVAAGTPQGGPIPLGPGEFVKERSGALVRSRLRRGPLEEVARAAGGRMLDLSGGPGVLAELYRRELTSLERTTSRSTALRLRERFQLPLALALALLCVEPLLDRRRKR